MAKMSSNKTIVTLTYASSGAQPPIFLAGSFSEPAWLPQEMEFATDKNGECNFHKEVEVDTGKEYQYKFRIGLGDWWALNEQAPTVIDDLGNRNNLLTVPSAKEMLEFSNSPEPADSSSISALPIPEVIIEKVDEEPRHGDDFGPKATIGQKDAHDMRAMDAEPDHVVIRSQTNTPVYANTAAEVADSAAMLDREPSPAPVSDEEAGRTGARRLSSTPIPQVALIAAEVADTAAIIDQDEIHCDSEMNAPGDHDPYDDHSGATTPWHERVPLFAHELLDPYDGDIEIPVRCENTEPPSKPEPEEHAIDFDDPTLERFPEDRLSILTHIRSCESRMSEDETNVQGVPPSPIAKPKSRSPSVDTPGSTRLDAQPSPALDVINEEHQEDDSYFMGLRGSSGTFQGLADVPLIELNAIDEVDEPTDDPRTVIENLKKIEQATAGSGNSIIEEEFSKQEIKGSMLERGTSVQQDHSIVDRADKTGNVTTTTESLSYNLIPTTDNNNYLHPRPMIGEVHKKEEDDDAGEAHYTEDEANISQVEVSDTAAHTSVYTSAPSNQHKTQVANNDTDFSNRAAEFYTPSRMSPEFLKEAHKNLKEHEEVNVGQSNVEEGQVLQDSGELLQAVHEHEPGNLAIEMPLISGQTIDPSERDPEAVIPEDGNPDDKVKTFVQPLGEMTQNEGLQDHDGHLPSVEAAHNEEQPLERAELAQVPNSQEYQQSQLNHVSSLPLEGNFTKNLPSESSIEVQGAAQDSTVGTSKTEHGNLEGSSYQSAVLSTDRNIEVKAFCRDDMPVSGIEADELSPATVHKSLGPREGIEQAPKAVGELTIMESQQSVTENPLEAGLPIVQAEADETLLSRQQEVLNSQVPELVMYAEEVLKDKPSTQEGTRPISKIEIDGGVDGNVVENQAHQALDSKTDKVATAEETQSELQTGDEADLPVSDLTPSHVNSGRTGTNNVDGIGSTLTNSVDVAKPTSVDTPSAELHDNESELTRHKTAPQDMDRPHTPSSIRSPTKITESQPQKSIWHSVFGEWLGGLLESLCGGERGPLLVICGVVVLGPLLAMYLLQPTEF